MPSGSCWRTKWRWRAIAQCGWGAVIVGDLLKNRMHSHPQVALLCGVVGMKLAGKTPPAAALGPLGIGPLYIAYQADFAYGNKADRVRGYYESIMVV